jgi:3-oxoacyl-[acyl-carrier protein] reductase
MFDLTGKNALVTGASGGLGASIAKTLLDAGASVTLSGTRQEKLEALKQEFASDKVHIAAANLSSREEVDGLIPAAEKAMGQVDILVNNAGITRDQIFMRMKDDDWDQLLEVNLTSSFRLARAAIKGMMKRRFGRIISITSVVGVTGNPGQANYAAAKAGMIGMSKSIAREVASRNITVNCVAPGFIETAMTDKLDDKQKEAILSSVPAGKLGKSIDIASAVLYLSSEEAGYVTGQTLHVNGGMAMI